MGVSGLCPGEWCTVDQRWSRAWADKAAQGPLNGAPSAALVSVTSLYTLAFYS